VFNVAASAIAVGVATVVIFLIFGDDVEAKQPAPAP
jgi:lipoprotein signal peptidase